MPALRQERWTMQEVERLVDAREGYTPRYELVDGELLVTPAPSTRHQVIVGELYVILREYVMRHHLGRAIFSPSTVTLAPQTRFEPDLYVVPLLDGRMPPLRDPVTRLLLAVEVLSPSSVRHDRITKRRFFQRHGVPAYWTVDGEAGAFEVWTPGDERSALVHDRLVWRPNDSAPPFELNVRRFFADLADEGSLPA